MKRKILKGLRGEEYIHGDELAMQSESLNAIIRAGLDKVNDISVALMRRMTLGRYIEVNETTAPMLVSIVKEVCVILDYPHIPRIYICHQAAQTIFCAGTDRMIIVISDYIVDHFDVDMLYFIIGNTISMFKSGHVGMVTAYAILPSMIITVPIELGIKKYLRAADMTSDRGGLLACQNISAALKCMLWEAGIPLNEIRFLDEKEMIQLAKAYTNDVENVTVDCVTGLAASIQEYTMAFMPHSYRVKELIRWYETGYRDIMQRRGGVVYSEKYY